GVLKTRGQIETIIERGIVLEVTAVEEVPDEQVVLLIDGVVHTREYVVIIRVPRDIQPVHGNSDPALERLDGINIVQDDRVVIRRLTARSEEHTSELQSLAYLVCRLLLEKKKKKNKI